jgi:hypothetical protein
MGMQRLGCVSVGIQPISLVGPLSTVRSLFLDEPIVKAMIMQPVVVRLSFCPSPGESHGLFLFAIKFWKNMCFISLTLIREFNPKRQLQQCPKQNFMAARRSQDPQ